MKWKVWHYCWRRSELKAAREAVEQSERDRDDVERLVTDLIRRSHENNFGPRINRALRLGGH